jgi:beta-lactamase class C
MLKKTRVLQALALLFNFTASCYGEPDTVKELIHRFRNEHQIPGCAVALYHNGKAQVFYDGVANIQTGQPVNADTLFEIGSITKSFTGVLLAYEVQQGWVELDTPLVETIPALRGAAGPIKAVTLKMLATHTSSFPRNIESFNISGTSPDDLFSFLKTWEPSYPVGTHPVYSNIGFAVLGYAIGNIAGMKYEEFLQRVILNPLKMHHTFLKVPMPLEKDYAQGYHSEDKPAKRWTVTYWGAGGGLKSSGPDMLKFLMANLGVDPEGAVLPLKLKEAMQFSHKGFYRTRKNAEYALGWWNATIEGERRIIKDGMTAGFSSYIFFLPEKKRGVVILCNRFKMGKHFLTLALKLLRS